VWLNPADNGLHGAHNFGSFTIDELRLWADDKGPVMRENKPKPKPKRKKRKRA